MAPITRPKHLLIDADIVLFKMCFRNELVVEWPNGVTNTVVNLPKAKYDTEQFLQKLLDRTKCQEFTLCFTHQLNFRYKLYPKYKSNRADTPRPFLLSYLKEWIQEVYPWLSRKYCEADDLIGILCTQSPDKYMAATIDKDFNTLPIWLYNWNTDELRRVSTKEADYNFHTQWLIGDSGDGYGGCYRIGKKRAEKLFKGEPPSQWGVLVIQTYDCNKLRYTWNDIVTQARMARILRHEDWDDIKQEPILWKPDL